jgi:hypothetical protein
MANIVITENQMQLVTMAAEFENNLKLAEQNWSNFSNKEKELVLEICKVLYPTKSILIQEAEWYNMVGDILGIVDPTGIVDIVNGISYFSQGDHLFGLLSLISAIPYAGDVVAKPVMGALKIGGVATKGLKSAMSLAKAGKTVEASAALAKLAEKPGIVGKFLQSARVWAPKVASKVEMLPGGLLKGFKKTIIDYLKLLQNAGSKSARFQKRARNLVKNMSTVANPAENIKALQTFLKTEKVATGLAKKGPLANIFLGGAPRLFGDRRMRILMRQTKWWLGFLDYIGVANFVGPDELSGQMSGDDIKRKMEEYNQTTEAKGYANEDFGNSSMDSNMSNNNTSNSNTPTSGGSSDPIQNMIKTLFGSEMRGAAMLAL